MLRAKISTTKEENIIQNAEAIEALLERMKIHLLTPHNKRGSFSHLEIINDINDIQKEIKRKYRYETK